jgi:hypothetical protein
MILVSVVILRDKTAVLPTAVMREPVISRAPSRMMSRELLMVIIVQCVYSVEGEQLAIAGDTGTFYMSQSFNHSHIVRQYHFYPFSDLSFSGFLKIRAFKILG